MIVRFLGVLFIDPLALPVMKSDPSVVFFYILIRLGRMSRPLGRSRLGANQNILVVKIHGPTPGRLDSPERTTPLEEIYFS